jgi:hypothetical protein
MFMRGLKEKLMHEPVLSSHPKAGLKISLKYLNRFIWKGVKVSDVRFGFLSLKIIGPFKLLVTEQY